MDILLYRGDILLLLCFTAVLAGISAALFGAFAAADQKILLTRRRSLTGWAAVLAGVACMLLGASLVALTVSLMGALAK